MPTTLTDSIWLGGSAVCSIEHLAEVSGLALEEIEDLVGSGLMEALPGGPGGRCFELRHVLTVTTARRLRDDFQLEPNGLALALTLLERIRVLEQQLLEAKGPT